MLINFIIALTFIAISLIVALNSSRILDFTKVATKRFHQLRLLIDTLVRAYKRYQKLTQLSSLRCAPHSAI